MASLRLCAECDHGVRLKYHIFCARCFTLKGGYFSGGHQGQEGQEKSQARAQPEGLYELLPGGYGRAQPPEAYAPTFA